MNKKFDIIVIGAGHAGAEAALAAARLGKSVLLLTMSLDAVAYMACNPAIGGTAKGHLVREIDALGGQMGIVADRNLLQLRMLNSAKGPAVHSLRGQADKITYHADMKRILEECPCLRLLEGEATELITNENKIKGVKTALGQTFLGETVVIATGVYLKSEIIIGNYRKKAGPSGFSAANRLSDNLKTIGFDLKRFKTGTPARINKKSIDFSRMEIQHGDDSIYPFSFLTKGFFKSTHDCWLTYTNQKTHDIIRANLDKSPMYNGSIKGTGPRYCPSIEDKVMRFADKERHQIFIEPEAASTSEMYVQGMSTSFPENVQEQIYRSIDGLENCEILRYAYAIEYDCIDSTALYPSLMAKACEGLFFAGQINGTSGYEEAAAQGLIAGINASRLIDGKKPLILGRDEAYIGVLIDDLVTKGTNEPYRMMTARAEYRLSLRQENADERLTPIAMETGLASVERIAVFNEKLRQLSAIEKALNGTSDGMSFKEMLKREVTAKDLKEKYELFDMYDLRYLSEAETKIRYEGYLKRQESAIAEQKRLENTALPVDFDYKSLSGLRIEAMQKLSAIKPLSLGQAARISGVSPADIAVLMVYLAKK